MLSVVDLVIEAAVLAYFIVIMVQLKEYYDNYADASASVLTDLI